MNHSYEIGENEAKLKNYTIFSNIEILEEAINKSKQVSFKYTRYGVDDNLKLELKNQIKKIVGKETI